MDSEEEEEEEEVEVGFDKLCQVDERKKAVESRWNLTESESEFSQGGKQVNRI